MSFFFRPGKALQQSKAVPHDEIWFRQHPRDAVYFSDLFAQAAPDCRIAVQVPVRRLNPDAAPDCVPVDFLFSRQDCPVLAVSLVYQDNYRKRPFRNTKTAVEQAGIRHLRFFADMANEPDYVIPRIRKELERAQVSQVAAVRGRRTVSVTVQADSRWDLLANLTSALAIEGVQVASFRADETANRTTVTHIRLSADHEQQIATVIRRLSGVAGVRQVRQET
ncbi:MAG: hypothetical protein LUH16_00030 [Clostridiales bacterium]|nr:hypothetical protein [Clostridiales bacterium]